MNGYYELDAKVLLFLRNKAAFEPLSKVLIEQEPAGLGSALQTAIWWIGAGNHALNAAQQVVALTTGLEALLIRKDMQEKTEPLSSHAAHLLCSTVEDREAMMRKMKSLYGLRSDVVHKGRTDVPEAELDDLKYYALAVLVEMAKRYARQEWKEVGDLEIAVKKAQVGGPSVSGSVSLVPRGPLMTDFTVRLNPAGVSYMLQPPSRGRTV